MEILYRGYDEISESWVYGFPLADADIKDRWYVVFRYTNFLDKIIVKKESLGMYSQMKDKHNNKIFEGDILELETADHIKIRVLCKFGKIERTLNTGWFCEINGFYFLRSDGLNSLPIVINWAETHDLKMMEIVGNITDTPKVWHDELS